MSPSGQSLNLAEMFPGVLGKSRLTANPSFLGLHMAAIRRKRAFNRLWNPTRGWRKLTLRRYQQVRCLLDRPRQRFSDQPTRQAVKKVCHRLRQCLCEDLVSLNTALAEPVARRMSRRSANRPPRRTPRRAFRRHSAPSGCQGSFR